MIAFEMRLAILLGAARRGGHGKGSAEYHGCTPTCAQATPQTALVAIRLSRIRVCTGQRYYSAVTLTMNSGQLLDRQFLERSWSPC